MLAYFSLTEQPEHTHSTTSWGIFSNCVDLVIVVRGISVNPREFRLAGTDRPPVKETWNASTVHHQYARCSPLFVTGRDWDNSWWHSTVLGSAASATGSKNRARHFYQALGHGDVTLKRPTAKSGLPVVQSSMSLKEAVQCNEKSLEPRRAQRGDYWVLYNYVPMSMAVRCWESVTYTTHADYTFLDNLEPLLERWRAPISIAMHAPGTDFAATLDAIKYSRNCGSSLVSQLVTFHVFFSSKHVPKMVPPTEKVMSDSYNCTLGPPWVNVTLSKMYKNEKKLLYPVNVGRNIARESAPTFYVLASDIELYPNPDLPAKFLEMIRRRDQPALYKPNPKVFVLSIFEVDEKSQPPNNKTHLVQMLKAGTAIPFHKKLCSGCHNVPRSKEWQEAPETEDLHVFHVGKRTGSFVHWEPIFIGSNNDPLYDERLSWEGKSDKMTQGYALCVLDYDFLILDNAFLVHRPGIKIFKKDVHREMLTAKTNALIRKIIIPELKILYGTRKGCAV
ncbi:beta-1,4-glucuronyltransferase 1 isoform X2 [Bombus fervidus]|uniref:beta-1,4-glucuronyltransferase 1 isoform X2 n=1 Tax=Bombus fervidus TaxID=203811 RepID=UPI003AB21CB0